MRKQFKLTDLLLIFIFCFLITAKSISAESSINKLKGKILLQVEQNGEAWYVNPDNSKKYFMGRPDDAFGLMRDLGTGISNNDLAKIQIAETNLSGIVDNDGDGLSKMIEDSLGTMDNSIDTDNDGYDDKTEILNGYNPNGDGKLNLDNNFANIQSCKILLQVEQNGEAWYVNPENNKRYFLGRPTDAFNIMRDLGLGITDNDLNTISTYEALEVKNDDMALIDPSESQILDFFNQYKVVLNEDNKDLDDINNIFETIDPEYCATFYPKDDDKCKQALFLFALDKKAINNLLNKGKMTIYEDEKQGIILQNNNEITNEDLSKMPSKFLFIKNKKLEWQIVTAIYFTTNTVPTDSDNDGSDDTEENCESRHAYNPACVKTDPTNKDTDSDGWWDGIEQQAKTNPNDANETPYTI